VFDILEIIDMVWIIDRRSWYFSVVACDWNKSATLEENAWYYLQVLPLVPRA
jgi:hypothetical protein